MAAACGTTGTRETAGNEDGTAARAPRKEREITRVVQREYRKNSQIFVMENEGGRDIKKLRSRVLKKGEPPVSYVPDDVMDRLLKEFDKLGFDKYAQARPGNPIDFGAIGELTVIDQDRKMESLLRIPLGGRGDKTHLKRTESYVECKKNFLAVYNFFRPQMQATAKVDFGVTRSGFKR